MTAVATQAPAATGAVATRPRRWAGWAVALRIARRETRRAKGRSALVLALVALPVLVVTVASTLVRTADVSVVESVPREMGAAGAAVQLPWPPDGMVVVQHPTDLTSIGATDAIEPPADGLTPAEAIPVVLGPGSRVLTLPSQLTRAAFADRSVDVRLTEADLADPMLVGMAVLREGRLPNGPGEVAVTRPLARRGAGLGASLDLDGFGPATVVGVVDSGRTADEVFAAPGGLGVPFVDDSGTSHYSRWLVTAPGGVGWEQVLQLNAHGMTVLSRQVVADPPTQEELAADPRTQGIAASMGQSAENGTAVTVLALIVAMALLEVVLLAGPAFAVGATSQTRALGLLAAQGGTRRQLRRVVLGQAVVLGGAAALGGILVGLLGTALAYPIVVRVFGSAALGPFDVGWADLGLVVALGFASAVLAALAPARAAARMDPVRAIAGRRPESRATRWHPVLGVVLVGVGVGLAWLGASGPSIGQADDGSVAIAAGAVASVVGAVLIAPLAIRALARLAGSARLSPRYAMRDMARNQLRTAPAVAAVAAVVAGTVALGIAGTSDSAQGRAQYQAGGPLGAAVVWLFGGDSGQPVETATWQGVAEELTRLVPGSTGLLVPALPDPGWGQPTGDPTLVLTASTVLPDVDSAFVPDSPGWAQQTFATGTWYQSGLLVGTGGLAAVRSVLTGAQYSAALAALADGATVVLRNTSGAERGRATFDLVEADEEAGLRSLRTLSTPAVVLQLPGVSTAAVAVVPESLAEQAGVKPIVSSLVLDADHDLTRSDQERLQRAVETSPALASAGVSGGVHVDVGWQNDQRLLLLVLGVAAGVLVLAGSLTAALLALSDARADFATLGAVGAAPRTRRRIAGAYGWAIAFLGAVLGAAVGFIPGVAITYPLTSASVAPGEGTVDLTGAPIADHYLVVPWLLVAVLVVGLPLLVGLLLALVTRSRLPMVARID